jgi:hypothetical protein
VRVRVRVRVRYRPQCRRGHMGPDLNPSACVCVRERRGGRVPKEDGARADAATAYSMLACLAPELMGEPPLQLFSSQHWPQPQREPPLSHCWQPRPSRGENGQCVHGGPLVHTTSRMSTPQPWAQLRPHCLRTRRSGAARRSAQPPVPHVHPLPNQFLFSLAPLVSFARRASAAARSCRRAPGRATPSGFLLGGQSCRAMPLRAAAAA